MKNANIVSNFEPTLPTFEVEYFIECTTFSALVQDCGGGVATKLGRNIQTFIYSKSARKKTELGQILHNCCSEARLVTKCCKFNRQLFEARNMTDLLTVSGNNHLLLEMLFARLLLKIRVCPFQK